MNQAYMIGGLIFGITWNLNGTCGLTRRQMRNLQHAAHAASMSDFRIKVGAVAVQGKQIISVGWSSAKTHPLQASFDRFREFRNNVEPPHSIHAEIMCLAPLYGNKDIDWKHVTLYVCRLRNDQLYGLARPCPACMAAIQSLGIRQIMYTTNDGFACEKFILKVS